MADSIKLNQGAMRDILRSAGVLADLRRRAARVAAAAGSGMKSDAGVGRNRARASVWTDTAAARKAEATNRALTRAIDAARG